VANGDDPRVRTIAARAGCRVVLCGIGPGCDLVARDLVRSDDGRWSFTVPALAGARLTAPLPGRFQVVNSLLAIGAARALGVPDEAIAARWPASLPMEHRMTVATLPDGTLLIDDAYNASPASVREAVTLLTDLPLCRRYALLGDMAELGGRGGDIHRHLGTWIARNTTATVIGVGPLASGLAESAAREGKGRGFAFASIDEAVAFLAPAMGQGAGILVKGSRAAGMERAVAAIARAAGGGVA
jgi:UDP-N-acetylmuramoyl-tripeptide--D-alanyl-D-alanine ligase